MKKLLAIILAVVLMVSAAMLPASAVSVDDLPEASQVIDAMDTTYIFVKQIMKMVHFVVGDILSILNKECPFCHTVHVDKQEPADPVLPETPDDANRIPVASDDEFLAALDSDNDSILVTGDITYDWGSGSYGNSLALKLAGKDIKGTTGKEVITFAGYGSANNIKSLTLSNVTVVDKTVGDNEDSWEHGYLEFDDLTATAVKFADSPQFNGKSTLTDCTFKGFYRTYGAWVNSGDVTFTNCTFNGDRGLKIHEAYGSDVASVIVDGCTFNTPYKPGVVIADLDASTVVTITDSIFNDCAAGDQGMYIYESDTPVDTFNFTESGNSVK